ncbi:MAG: periplasmic heavy metal sensor [Deltaproteobacteria bacterium]|nr:MAG: periplasmic heavy metal sensor [Deltaproteobacteria bacterium]
MLKKIVVVSAVSLLFLSTGAFAAGPGRGPGHAPPPGAGMFGGPGPMLGGMPGPGTPGAGPGRLLPLLLRSADLTAEQKAEVRKILDSHRPAFRRLFTQLRQAHQALAERLFTDGDLRAGQLAPEVNRVADLRKRLMREGLDVVLEVRRLLTPEQRKKVARTRAKLEELRREMHEILGEPPLGDPPPGE